MFTNLKNNTCPKCESDNWEEGALTDYFGLKFFPKSRKWFEISNFHPVKGRFCKNCGYLELFVNLIR